MTAWIILLLLVLVIFLISRLHLGAIAEYNQSGLCVKLRIGWLKITVYPANKKKSGRRQSAQKKEKKLISEPTLQVEHGGSLELVKEFLPLICEAAGQLRKKIQIDQVILHLTWAAQDPASAALGFGAGNAILGMIWPLLDHNFYIKDRDIGVAVHFEQTKPNLYLLISASLTIGQTVAFGIYYAIRSLQIYRRYKAPPMRERKSDGGEKLERQQKGMTSL